MLTLALIFVLGVALGSFAYVLALRSQDGRNWISGRSECEHCKHLLSTFDLIPVLSWLVQRGRCRYCKKTLSVAYPMVELGMGALIALSWQFWPFAKVDVVDYAVFALWVVLATILVALFIIDIKHMLLPDKFVFPAFALAGAMQAVLLSRNFNSGHLIELGASIMVGAGLFMLIFVFSKGRYIGGGDVKFGLVFGTLLGTPFLSLLVISIASLLGTIIALPLLITKKAGMNTALAFGPMLIVSTIIVFVFGKDIESFLTTVYIFP